MVNTMKSSHVTAILMIKNVDILLSEFTLMIYLLNLHDGKAFNYK